MMKDVIVILTVVVAISGVVVSVWSIMNTRQLRAKLEASKNLRAASISRENALLRSMLEQRPVASKEYGQWVGLDSLHSMPNGSRLYAAPAQDRQTNSGALDMVAHLHRQIEWSERTFGPGARTKGVIDHIRKELAEIEADPLDVKEWVDVIILAFDGAWRAGWQPVQILQAIFDKQEKNENRTWPDWRTMSPDKAIEHDRSKD
jgi:hypothetical protein